MKQHESTVNSQRWLQPTDSALHHDAPSIERAFLFGSHENAVEGVNFDHKSEYSTGTIETYRVHMTDGTEYDLKHGEPLQRTTDIGTSTTTALFTRLRGMNKRMMLATMGLGMPIDALSTEQAFSGLPHLAQSARNQLAVLDYTQEKFKMMPNISTGYGISRSAMILLGMAAMSEDVNQSILYHDDIVPCYPEPLNVIRDFHELRKQPLNELTGLMRHIGQLPLRHLLLYPKTIDTSPRGFRSHLASIPTLVSGITGEFADNLPFDSKGKVTVFSGDIMSQSKRFEAKLRRYPGIAVDVIPDGSHGDCASQQVYDNWLLRRLALRDELVKYDGDAHAMDWEHINLPLAA